MRTQVWSSGGGTQSAAIAALICRGELRPDISVIVDTQREVAQTWKYHDEIIVPSLAKVGVTLHRVPKSRYTNVDLWGGKDGNSLLIPAFQTNTATGEQGKLPAFCSNEWKARVVQRFCRDLMPDCKGFDIWLGISRDEADRMKVGHTGKWQYCHPLIDDGRLLSRQDCRALIQSMGWPKPPRSRCYMCPNQVQDEWDDLEQNWPADNAKADKLERKIQERDPAIYLHDAKATAGCTGGFCFT